MDRVTELNPYLKAPAAPDILTNTANQTTACPAVPITKNFNQYNATCKAFSLTAFFNGIKSHEALGTLNQNDPLLANGHQARIVLFAKMPANDPYVIAEPAVKGSRALLTAYMGMEVGYADQDIRAGADSDHLFVHGNYGVAPPNCMKVWELDSTGIYSFIALPAKDVNNAPICI